MNYVNSEVASKIVSQTDKGVVKELHTKIINALHDERAANSLVALASVYASLMWNKFPEHEWGAVMTIWPHLVSQITETWSMRADGNHRRGT